MKRLLVLVEGQTEEAFFNRVLRGHLAQRGVGADCTMVCTSRDEHGGRTYRGGHLKRWHYIERDLRLLLWSRPDAVTTMLDVYGFPKDMPGYPDPWPQGTSARVNALGEAMSNKINDPRFFPGLLAHEFEGLLFAEPSHLVATAVPDPRDRPRVTETLVSIARSYPTPEDIDDGFESAPSKRIKKLIPGYNKPRHGVLAAERIGLAVLRQRCPLFSAWLGRLEAVGASATGAG